MTKERRKKFVERLAHYREVAVYIDKRGVVEIVIPTDDREYVKGHDMTGFRTRRFKKVQKDEAEALARLLNQALGTEKDA